MVLVLLAATLISGLIGEVIDAITIMFIVLLNEVLGYVQERKAEKSLDALKELSAPQMMVKRDGEWVKFRQLKLCQAIWLGLRVATELVLILD